MKMSKQDQEQVNQAISDSMTEKSMNTPRIQTDDNQENVEAGSRITKEDIRKAFQKLQKFKMAKKSVDDRIVDDEEWFRQRQWKYMRSNDNKEENRDRIEPTSAWMFNSLFNKHADAMDNYPTCNFMPREESDRKAAEELSAIVPVILKINGHRKKYSRSWWYLLKFGSVVEGTFWDKRKYYGMGDVAISQIDILNFFPEPNILDIQDSSDVFFVHLENTEKLLAEYPQLEKNNLHNDFTLSRYVHDDYDNSDEKSAVIDWYYKKYTENGTVLHYCQFVGDEILYASENDPEFRDRGFYDHGEYPFDVTTLFPTETSLFGFGFIDIMRSPQAYIDRLDQAILTNAAMLSKPRALISDALGINKEELADMDRSFISVKGSISQGSYQPLTVGNMSAGVMQHYLNKINELKETSGNRDVNQGSSGGGITSGTAIAALQESGSKGSRDMLQGYYTSFESQCKKIASLITQFYDLPRKFRITNSQGQEEFISFSNEGVIPRQDESGSMRIPEFDIDIVAQKQNRYTTNSNNEMALAFYNAGFFNPQNSDQALACVDMMSFDNKEQVANKIRENGLMYQQIQQMQQQIVQLSQIVAAVTGDNRVMNAVNVQAGMTDDMANGSNLSGTKGMIGKKADNSQAEKARARVQEAAQV